MNPAAQAALERLHAIHEIAVTFAEPWNAFGLAVSFFAASLFVGIALRVLR